MFIVSTRLLNMLAALVWYIGGFVLLFKGIALLAEASLLQPGQNGPWFAAIIGLTFGGVKAKFVFSKSCGENLVRIAALNQPKIWQFFRPGFFVSLAAMILVGATMSRLAHDNYPLLMGVAILDLSIGTALLGSSYMFWTQKA